jgi:hypothetical protein
LAAAVFRNPLAISVSTPPFATAAPASRTCAPPA